MKKIYLIILVLCGLIILSCNAFAETHKYRIGVIIPLSGQVASLGNYVKKGIDLAFEDLKPSERNKIELVYEDDQFDPAKTVNAYQKLKSTGGLDAVLVMASPPANALSPITEKDKVILIAIGASDPTISKNKNYSFIHWVIPPVLAEKLSNELIRRDFKKIALVVVDASGAIADANAVEDYFKKQNLSERIVYNQNFLMNTIDFRSTLLQIRQRKADAVIAVLFSGGLSSFAKQYREMNMPAELIGIETFEDEPEVKAANGALNNTWYANAADNTSSFVSAYNKKYGEHPGWAAGNAYDSLRLIAEAVDTGANNSEAVKDFLRSLKDYQGATGTYSASGDNRFTLPASLKRVTSDGFKTIETSN